MISALGLALFIHQESKEHEKISDRSGNVGDYLLIDVGDYLLIDVGDFYSELARRNLYLKDHIFDKNKVIEFNTRCLDLAEKTLNDIDWNKFR
jgi:hypothetical protein